ncbi:histidinol dehydrogenase [Thermicanus aegyptius]|uniref:histidinol dehydrogenase n=1 Tax=Thermicanus aegyptius TaxID=94009 RepID=UPI0004262A4F|nr:histidinol dehydrogenase [Thermicanus aegyptius]
MQWLEWAKLGEEEKRRILTRAEKEITTQMEIAQEIIAAVREEGDRALIRFTARFDRVELTSDRLKVKEEEIDEGYERLKREDPLMVETIQVAYRNIRKFHEEQMPKEFWFTEIDRGIMAGEKVTPISDVALYVPRGKGSFPSVFLMLGVPAVVAGVPRIIVVTPPNEKGTLDDSLLAVAKVTGIREIYKVGGAQAVAAVAYGTETIPRVRKILGPGNPYVTAAKRLLTGLIDVGLPAGPSEAIILADENADPEKAALDLMIEAEHGPDSASLLVTHSRPLAEKVAEIVEKQLPKLSPRRREFVEQVLSNFGGILLTQSLEESIQFVNRYAPEHMEILVEDPFSVLPKIKNAGEILLGEYTPITLCNFLLGPNAILPTGGFAKSYSSVSVWDYLKRSSIGYVTQEGFERVRSYAAHFAKVEGFDSHRLAVEERR